MQVRSGTHQTNYWAKTLLPHPFSWETVVLKELILRCLEQLKKLHLRVNTFTHPYLSLLAFSSSRQSGDPRTTLFSRGKSLSRASVCFFLFFSWIVGVGQYPACQFFISRVQGGPTDLLQNCPWFPITPVAMPCASKNIGSPFLSCSPGPIYNLLLLLVGVRLRSLLST